MSGTCIDCGLPALSGSSYCGPCNAPIYESPRQLSDQFRLEMETDA